MKKKVATKKHKVDSGDLNEAKKILPFCLCMFASEQIVHASTPVSTINDNVMIEFIYSQ